MAFGDWELFRMVIVILREMELTSFTVYEEGSRSVRFTVGSEQMLRKGMSNTFFSSAFLLRFHQHSLFIYSSQIMLYKIIRCVYLLT